MAGSTMAIEVIRVNGTRENRRIGTRDPFAEINKLIGCDVTDTINLRDGRIMLVDDLGHQKNLSVNPIATDMYWAVCRPGTRHQIVGDVIVAVDADFA